MTYRRTSAFAIATSAALGATSAAHATFVIDTSCGQSSCNAGTQLFIDNSNSDVSTFGASVGRLGCSRRHRERRYGSGFATIKPASGASLTDLIFTPANRYALQRFFVSRDKLETAGFTGAIDVEWTDSAGTARSRFTVPKANQEFDRLGIVSNDGETLKSVDLLSPRRTPSRK